MGIICVMSTSLFFTSYILFGNDDSYDKHISPIPLLAGICDIIGIGRVTNTWENGEGVYIAVDNYWRGNPGYDSLSVSITTNLPPISNDPLVFFVLKHYGYFSSRGILVESGFSYIFEKPNIQTHLYEYEEGPVFYQNKRSWFPVSDTNLVNFATNLVRAVDAINTNLFYEIIRDGYNMHPEGSRIHEDSWYTFDHCEKYFTTNFMVEVMWWDPLLQRHPRGCLINNYPLQNGLMLHEVLPRP